MTLHPLPDHDPLKVGEVAAALGVKYRTVLVWLGDGQFPGAFRNPGENGPGHWRIPRKAAEAVRMRMAEEGARAGLEPSEGVG